MKIGFDAKRAFLNASGLGNYSRNTLKALFHYFPENHYTLFTPEIKKKLFTSYKKFDVISPDSSLSKIFKSLWRSFSLSGQLKKNKLDLFHGLSNELPDGIHKTEVPSVVTIHDLIFMRFPEFYRPIDRNIYFQKVKYACTSANKIIAISDQTKKDIVEFIKIAPEKIEVIYQSIPNKYFQDYKNVEILSKYDIPEQYILAVGSIEQRKNQLSILKAIHSSKLGITVVFVGKPKSYAATLLKFITDNGMENQVKFLNNIPGKELAGLYQLANLSIYLSKYEGFGLPVIESMASGCPVITSSVSCLPETAGGAALLCDPEDITNLADSIKQLLDNDTLRNELIEKGKERAKLFHAEIYSQNLISLYSKIIST
jgi:glycosyltransferase involved in cell wall biosynthesis